MNIHTQSASFDLQINMFKYCRFVNMKIEYGFTNPYLQTVVFGNTNLCIGFFECKNM